MVSPNPMKFGSVEEIYNDDEDKVLGVGSYGKVCRAKYGQLPCAAKLLHETMFEGGDPGISKFAEKFVQECQFLSKINHPNIVQYLATSRKPKSQRLALLMELMDESLTRFLDRFTGPIPYHIQLNICHDVALALSYLHSNAIIHRDLSSNNVLLIGEGSRAKVTDFGMSKLMDSSTRLTPMTLCPGATVYMPPEALTNPSHYSSKLDCFSHGVLTIQIITRNFPKPGDAHQSIEDPKYPSGRVIIQRLETERRKKDIDLIEPGHPLLPIALHCLHNKDTERPSADELCEKLFTLKGEEMFMQSVKQSRDSATLVQRLHKELEDNHRLIERERADYQQEKDDFDNKLAQRNRIHHNELQRERAEFQQEKAALENQIARKDRLLQKARNNCNSELQKEKAEWQEERAVLESELLAKDKLLQKCTADFQKEKADWQQEKAALESQLADKDRLLQKSSADLQRKKSEKASLEIDLAQNARLISKARADGIFELQRQKSDWQEEMAALESKLSQKDQLLQESAADLQKEQSDRLQEKEALENKVAQKDSLLQKSTADLLRARAEWQQEKATMEAKLAQKDRQEKIASAQKSRSPMPANHSLSNSYHFASYPDKLTQVKQSGPDLHQQPTGRRRGSLDMNAKVPERKVSAGVASPTNSARRQAVQASQDLSSSMRQTRNTTYPPRAAVPVNPIKLTWMQETQAAPQDFSSLKGRTACNGNTVYFSCDHDIYSFTVLDKKWTKLAECKYEQFSMAVVHGNLTTIGGQENYYCSKTNVLLSLVPGFLFGNNWKEVLPPMPTSQASTTAVTTHTNLVVASRDVIQILNTKTSQWSTASINIPMTMYDPFIILCEDGNLYLRQCNTMYSCSVEDLLKSSTDTGFVWTRRANIPVHYDSSLVSVRSNMLAIGGKDMVDKVPTADLFYYDKVGNSWRVVGRLPAPLSGALVAVLPSNQVVVVCGTCVYTGK